MKYNVGFRCELFTLQPHLRRNSLRVSTDNLETCRKSPFSVTYKSTEFDKVNGSVGGWEGTQMNRIACTTRNMNCMTSRIRRYARMRVA